MEPTDIRSQLLERKKFFLERRRSLLAWCLHNGDVPALHHKLIIDSVTEIIENLFRALVRGEQIPEEPLNLMVMTPPGTAKSTYLSKNTPPWFLAQWSRVKHLLVKHNRPIVPLGILACSHSDDYATKWGRAARNLVLGNEDWLGYSLSRDSQAADEWSLTNGCSYKAAGVNKGISGTRMHLGIIDDFCGKEADAHSKLFNDNTWNWYIGDFRKRLQPIAAQVLIYNHRDEDDLGGRILATEAKDWKILKLRLVIENKEQAEQDPLGRKVGERIWPEYFTATQVESRMKDPNASGIEQQDPSPEKGAFFEKDNILGYKADMLPLLEREGRCYGASDHAVRTNQRNDNTCMGVAFFYQGILYIHPDLTWDRLPSNQQVVQMLRYAKQHKPLYWWAEKENISGSIGPILKDRMQEERAFMSVTEVAHRNKDLMARAQSIHSMTNMGLVKYPTFAPWWPRAQREMLVFPNGGTLVHDDFVSFIALLGKGIYQMVSPNAKKPQQEPIKPVGMNITMHRIKAQQQFEKRLVMSLD